MRRTPFALAFAATLALAACKTPINAVFAGSGGMRSHLEASAVAGVLDHWQQAGWGSLRQPAVPASGPPAGWQVWPVQVAGAQHLRAWKGPGLDHQGRALQARQVYFAQGGMAYQAAVYGPALTEVGVAPFFEALRHASRGGELTHDPATVGTQGHHP